MGFERFDAIWAEAVGGEQPVWLAAAEAASPGRFHLAPDHQDTLVANTVAVLTTVPEQRAEWRAVVANAGAHMAGDGLAELVALNNAILALLDDQPAELAPGNEYHALWQRILDGVAQGGLSEISGQTDGAEIDDAGAGARMAAINAFVGADHWAASRRVVEEQQEILLSAEVEQIFLENIARTRANGDNRTSAYLQQHLDLLRACRHAGIDAAFGALAAAATDSDDEDGSQLPVAAALIDLTIAALRGSPQDRIAHMQTVLALAAQAEDPALQAFWRAVQMALVGGDLREAGHGLAGVYVQVWQAIVAGVTGRVTDEAPADLLDVLVHNTLAVLGPAHAQREQWIDQLAQLHGQAAADGIRELADLVEAIQALLAAGGKPAGLGVGLDGRFAAVWRQIVEGL